MNISMYLTQKKNTLKICIRIISRDLNLFHVDLKNSCNCVFPVIIETGEQRLELKILSLYNQNNS